MWKHALEKLVSLFLWGAWPVCHYCHSARCLDETYAFNEEHGTYYDCLAGCSP